MPLTQRKISHRSNDIPQPAFLDDFDRCRDRPGLFVLLILLLLLLGAID